MKRNDLTTGQTYAWQARSYLAPEPVTVLTTDPYVDPTPSYAFRRAEPGPVTLPDGTVVQAVARPAEPSDKPAEKGVLIRTASGWVGVVRLVTLLGEWEEYQAQQEVSRRVRAEYQQAQAQRDGERTTRLNSASRRASALLGHPVLVRDDPDFNRWVIDPDQVEALLTLAEQAQGQVS